MWKLTYIVVFDVKEVILLTTSQWGKKLSK